MVVRFAIGLHRWSSQMVRGHETRRIDDHAGFVGQALNPSERITVVVTCYMEGALLQRAIRSLEAQTCQSFDTVVVNDASPCIETNRICEQLGSRPRTTVVRNPVNGGLSVSRNRGFAESKTDICMFLDGDDELPPLAVESTLNAIGQYPDADFYFGNYLLTEVDNGRTSSVDCSSIADPSGWLVPPALLGRWVLSGHSPCRKRVWARIGGYQRSFSYGYQDVDFYMRALQAGFRGAYVDAPLYHWYRSPAGMNASRMHRMLFFDAYSWRYYQTLGRQDDFWERTIMRFFETRQSPQVRSDARKLLLRMFPDRSARAKLYLSFAIRVCGPAWIDRLWSS